MNPDDDAIARWRQMFQRFVDALNAPRDAERLAAAVTADVSVHRHRPGVGMTEIAERFTGIDELARWFARTPPHVVFSLVGDPWVLAGEVGIKYGIAVDDFYNEGIWLATVSPDARIASLAHRPFPLSGS